MKQNNSITKRISSGRKSRFLATWQMLHRVVAILVLAFVCSEAWATDYVFVYNGNYLGIDANGNIKNYTTFDPANCVWTCYNGANEVSLQNSNTLYSLKNGSYYLTGKTDGSAIGTSNTEQKNWRRDGDNHLIYRSSNNYYLYYRGNSWRTSRSTGGKDTDYSSTGKGAIDYRATATASTTSNAKDDTTLPTVSCDGLNSTTGILMSHTTLGGTYTPAITTIKVGTTTYYKGSDGTYSTTAPSATINPTYTWSISSGSASITNGGVLTLNNNNSQTITVRLTVTNTNPSLTKTVDYTLTATQTEELNETTYSGITITPSSQTLDLGGTATYTVSPSISQVTKTRPQYVTITDQQNHTHYKVGNNYQAAEPTITETPGSSINLTSVNWTFSGGDGNYYTPSDHYSTSNTLTLTRSTTKTASNQTFTITASAQYGSIDKEGTASVTIPLTYTDLTDLYAGEAVNVSINESENLDGHYTWQPNNDAAGAAYKKFTYTSGDTDIATVDASGKVTGVAPGSTTITIQSIKIDGTINTNVECEITVNVSIAAPTISIDPDGYVTITPPVASLPIRYTTDGTNPTATTGTEYSGTFGPVSNETVVKAVAVSNSIASSVASNQYITSGISSDGKVILNDYEDHNWAYYKGRDIKVGTASDAPNYKDKYKYTLYSPDPRNVKITYRGFNTDDKTIYLGGSAPVATSTLNTNTTPRVSNVEGEGQNTFVFYKTLEKFVIGYFTDSKDWNGIPDDPTKENYPYTVISNPFSVRPSTGSGDSKKYYGFAGWKIISGGEYIQNHANNDVLKLDELIHFTFDDDESYTPNCTSADVVLEATWTQATRWSGNTAHEFTGGTYETNFIVASDNIGSIEQKSPCTIIGMNPDGTDDNSGTRTITGLKVTTTSTTDPYDRSNCVKVEWIRHGDGTFDANGRNMTMGRGIISSSGSGNTAQGNVYGNNTNGQNVVNTVKVESGYYSKIANLNTTTATATNAINSYMILGCDYDRALTNYYVPANEINNNAYNIKLRASRIYGPNGNPDLHRAYGQLYMRSLFKSGVFASEIGNEYYFHTYQRPGQRYIEMEGGYNKGHVKGGSDGSTSQGRVRAMSIRMKGGRIDGQLACGSTSTFCSGDRLVVITGGRIGGWIAPGSNCSSGGSSSTSTTGTTDGTSYVYFGGTAEINSRQFGTTPSMIYQSTGGVIYGAGLGYKTTDRTGEMTHGSNIVFADDAYCERGIYGGGAIGQTLTTANIFILGGRVGTGTGQIKDQGTGQTYNNVKAGVYGGACNRGGENSFIYMDDGTVESGIYGGANINGTMTSNVTMQINGGQVGTDDASANIHGGGYGNSTRVQGSVNLTVGASGATEGVTVYGDVYGGSAEGKTNGNNGLTSGAETNVTLNAGTINGSLYGGGLGTSSYAADVYGPVMVTVNGGTVNTTSIAGSGAVYGCNNVNGTPKSDVTVTINGTDEHIPASGTEGQPGYTPAVYAISEVYGGGNMANYSPASADNACKVIVNNCESSIGYVYGGGNAADVPSTDVTINGGIIGQVFGGGHGNKDASPATEANVSGDVNVLVTGGTINQVFAGSNSKGTIGGSATVKVEKSSATNACEMHVTELYGGGNEADGKAGTINIISTGDKSKNEGITDVYGGARKANVTSGITLNIKGGNIGRAFGGNNVSGSVSGAIVVNVNETSDVALNINSVYGGGNQAAYTGSPEVNILNGTINQNVFGGGLGASAIVTGDPEVTVGDDTDDAHHVEVVGNVFGGGDAAAVEGEPTVTIVVCGTTIDKDVYGGGNAAPVYSTKVYMRAGTVLGNVFGGGNGKGAGNPGANVGYDHNNDKVTGKDSYGTTYVVINGGTVGTWTSETVCKDGTGGVFGGSNTKGDVWNKSTVLIEGDNTGCPMKVMDVYGAGNEAYMNGTANLEIGCHAPKMEYLFGGAKNADVMNDINLVITNGSFGKVFGGNNMGGRIYGKITVTIDETGCSPILIDELYGGGYNAPYDVNWGKYDASKDAGDGSKNAAPTVNIISFSHIGKVFGGGYGAEAVITGDPVVNIQQIPGTYDPENSTDSKGDYNLNSGNKLGTIDTVFGGGNAANINGNTYVNIGNEVIVTRADGTNTVSEKGANITGNVYGGGNQADVIGKTNVVVGKK